MRERRSQFPRAEAGQGRLMTGPKQEGPKTMTTTRQTEANPLSALNSTGQRNLVQAVRVN